MGRFSFLAMSLAGASVALVILVDLATGQGPPVLNAYMSRLQAPPEFRQPGPPFSALNYPPRVEYESRKVDYKDKEEYKKERKELEKEEIHSPYPGKKYEKEYELDKSTPAPGYMSSLSNSMSGAWKTLTSLGRSKRSDKSGSSSRTRSFDDLELQHYSNQGYIFFKVPKSLVCDGY